MVLGAELGLLAYGVYVLITGKYALGKQRFVYGWQARVLGVICLLPLPTALLIGILIGLSAAGTGKMPGAGVTTAIEVVILIATIVLITLLGKRFYQQQADTP